MVVRDVSFKYLDALHALEHLDKGLSTKQTVSIEPQNPVVEVLKTPLSTVRGVIRVQDRHT